MIQIIPAARSFGGEFASGLAGGFTKSFSETINKGMEEKKQKKVLTEQNKQLKDKFGIDLSGIKDPKEREIILKDTLKQMGKQQELKTRQDYLDNLFGGKKPSNGGYEPSRSVGQQLQSEGQQLQSEEGEPIALPEGFDVTKISDEDIVRANAVDPVIGRSLQHAKDVSLREKSAKDKLDLAKKKMSPEYQREQHIESSQAQADIKYNQQLQEASKQHELKEQSLERLETLNNKGVTGKPYEKVLEKMGLVSLTSEGRREFAADVKNLITDIRSILGSQFTGFEFQTILNAYPSADFSKEANSSIIRNLKQFQDIKKKEVEFAKEIKKQNGGKIPFDFQAQVNDQVKEYANSKVAEIKENTRKIMNAEYANSKVAEIKENTRKIMNAEYGIPEGKTLMFDPKGEPLSVPHEDIDKYIELGASLP